MVSPYRIDGRITMIPVGTVWHYRFRVDKKRRQHTTLEPLKNTARAEQVARDAHQAALMRSRGEEPEPILEYLVAEWIQAHALQVSASHVASLERFGRLHLFHLAKLRLSELATKSVQDALNLFLRDHQKSSANQWLINLRLLLGYALRRKMIREIPYQVPKLKVKAKPKFILPDAKAGPWLERVERLCVDEPGIAVAIRLMMCMGLRECEALSARWQWLDLDRVQYTPGDTKGGEAWERPIPERFLEWLRPLAKPEGLLAVAENGGKLTPQKIRRVIVAANEACGIIGLTPHRLRATYATMLSEEGVPIQDIQHILGHKKIETTMVYLGWDMERVRRGQRGIEQRCQIPGRESGERPMPKPRGV